MSGIELKCISFCSPIECAQYDQKADTIMWHNRVNLYEIFALCMILGWMTLSSIFHIFFFCEFQMPNNDPTDDEGG